MLTLPVTMWYFSPVLPVAGAYMGKLTGSLIVFAALFAGSLVLGRAWCGWACPAAGLQEACALARDRRTASRAWGLLRWIIWAPWAGATAFLAFRAGGFREADLFFGTTHGISVAEPAAHVVYYSVLALIVAPALGAGRRAFCRYVCWMAPFMIIGRKLSNLARAPALRLSADREKCVECGACTRVCPMSLEVARMVESGNMESAECVLCGSCADACPRGAISFTFRGDRR